MKQSPDQSGLVLFGPANFRLPECYGLAIFCDHRVMRRSTNVIAPLLASTAVALLVGCNPLMQRCIDDREHVADPTFCKDLPVRGSEIARTHDGSYRFYYGGSGGYEIGTLVADGTLAPIANQEYSSTHGTAREGFGTFFSDNSEILIFVAAFGIFATASAFSS